MPRTSKASLHQCRLDLAHCDKETIQQIQSSKGNFMAWWKDSDFSFKYGKNPLLNTGWKDELSRAGKSMSWSWFVGLDEGLPDVNVSAEEHSSKDAAAAEAFNDNKYKLKTVAGDVLSEWSLSSSGRKILRGHTEVGLEEGRQFQGYGMYNYDYVPRPVSAAEAKKAGNCFQQLCDVLQVPADAPLRSQLSKLGSTRWENIFEAGRDAQVNALSLVDLITVMFQKVRSVKGSQQLLLIPK